MKVDREEAFRYLRMKVARADAEFMARYERIEREVIDAAKPKAYWRLGEVVGERIGQFSFASASLERELAGCSRAFLFVATLGASVDARLRRFAATSAADELIADAIATALIEGYCDECMTRLAAEVPEGRLGRRFSPGYGDFALDHQRQLLAILEADRRLGVMLTESQMMTPSKSVSAVVGVKDEKKCRVVRYYC